jgi:hypothetical protein
MIRRALHWLLLAVIAAWSLFLLWVVSNSVVRFDGITALAVVLTWAAGAMPFGLFALIAKG